MHPTKPSNTQIYSPFGSFVVEQHDESERHDAIRQRYQTDTSGWEKSVAITWTLLLTGLVVGSIYVRFWTSQVAATSSAEVSARIVVDDKVNE